ncbi:MAG: hypothetical protein KBT11_09260 [Treponema sp.]|nr:hypothetical protein [Candidatus Treponema equifaecale]
MEKIFEYSYQSCFGSNCETVCIEKDGSVYRKYFEHGPFALKYNSKKLIFKSPDMIKDIMDVLKKRQQILLELPEKFDNPDVLDGGMDTLVLGDWHFEGFNIIQVDSESELDFKSVLELEEYMRGEFYSAELQKVFREIKTIIDAHNETKTILWHFDEPPPFLKKYDFDIEELFPAEELKVQTFRIGDSLPFNVFSPWNEMCILTRIKRRATKWDITTKESQKSTGHFSVSRGEYQLAEYEYKGKSLPVLYFIENVDENSLSVRLCAIEKEYLNENRKFFFR